MTPIKQIGLGLAFLAFGSPSRAQDPAPFDVPHDEPNRVAVGTLRAPTRLVAADGLIDTGEAWAHSSPWVEDVDGDGVRDLVVGDFSGLFRFYRNTGTNARPAYAASVNLKAGNEDAKVRIY